MNKKFKFDPHSYAGLDKLGRIPLLTHFYFREFLYSEIAAHYNIRNVPDDIDSAVKSGQELCRLLLEPLQEAFGRIHIRSGYRSRAVNEAGVEKHNCSIDNDGDHTWDFPSKSGNGSGAMACVTVPRLSRLVLSNTVDISSIAWWIHDHLSHWSVIEFFATPADIPFADEVAFNIGWHETPKRVIKNWRGGLRNLHDHIPDPESRKKAWIKLSEMPVSK